MQRWGRSSAKSAERGPFLLARRIPKKLERIDFKVEREPLE